MANSAMPADTSAINPEQQLDDMFIAAYIQYRPMVRRIITANLNDGDKHLADDLMQETFLRIYRQGVHLDEIRSMPGFLGLASRRTVLDWYRIKRNRLEIPVDTGHWRFANRSFNPSAASTLAPARPGYDGDSDPDMNEALRRVRSIRPAVSA